MVEFETRSSISRPVEGALGGRFRSRPYREHAGLNYQGLPHFKRATKSRKGLILSTSQDGEAVDSRRLVQCADVVDHVWLVAAFERTPHGRQDDDRIGCFEGS